MIHKLLSNNLFAFLLVVPFTLCFLSSLFSPVFVSADSLDFQFPENPVYFGLSESAVSDFLEDIYNNSSVSSSGYSDDNCYTFISYFNSNYTVYLVHLSDIDYSKQLAFYSGGSWHYFPLAIFNTGLVYNGSSNNFSSGLFTSFTSNPTGNLTSWGISFTNSQNGFVTPYYIGGLYFDSYYMHYSTNENNFYRTYYFGTNYIPPFVPDFSDSFSFTGLNLDFNETDFYNWLVDNDKIEISVSSGGSSVSGKIPAYIGLQKLKSFISFYKQYGGSNISFFKFIKGWFSYMNIANQTGDNINLLKNTIDNLYREYLNSYIVNSYSNTLNHAHQRKNIQTNTDDNNTILITDDSNDSVDTSILRDILRGIISLSSSITSHFEALFDKLNQLDFTVNVSNNGGSSFDSNIIWGTGDITQSENYLALTNAFMDKGVDVSAAENMKINYLDNATQSDSFTVSVVMPDQYVNGQFTEKTVTHTIDNTSKMYNTLILFRKLIAFAVIAFFAIRIRFELPHLIRGE